jgi:hypothetical protein
MNEISFICLAIVSYISILLAYSAGQKKILNQFEERTKRRRERELRWKEFEEED